MKISAIVGRKITVFSNRAKHKCSHQRFTLVEKKKRIDGNKKKKPTDGTTHMYIIKTKFVLYNYTHTRIYIYIHTRIMLGIRCRRNGILVIYNDINIFFYFYYYYLQGRKSRVRAHGLPRGFCPRGVDVNPTRPIQTSKLHLSFYYYYIITTVTWSIYL